MEQAKFDRKLAAIEVRQAQALLDRRSVQSPLTGRVVAVDAAVGEFANEQTSIMEIVQTDPIHVEVFAPGELFGRITEGEIHEVVLMPPLDGRFNATVAVVDRLFDTASGTFGVRLEIDNPKSIVPSGARCRGRRGAARPDSRLGRPGSTRAAAGGRRDPPRTLRSTNEYVAAVMLTSGDSVAIRRPRSPCA